MADQKYQSTIKSRKTIKIAWPKKVTAICDFWFIEEDGYTAAIGTSLIMTKGRLDGITPWRKWQKSLN